MAPTSNAAVCVCLCLAYALLRFIRVDLIKNFAIVAAAV